MTDWPIRQWPKAMGNYRRTVTTYVLVADELERAETVTFVWAGGRACVTAKLTVDKP